MIIAVDGPTASGKGTIARALAAHFGLPHLDTGLLYRAVGRQVFLDGGDPDDPADALAATATEIVEKNDGKVTKTETWGLKSLAYKIDRNRKAHFVLLNIEGPGSVVEELERQTRINEDVIRYMTIRVDEHEDGPSVMMRKNERDKKRRSDREERD